MGQGLLVGGVHEPVTMELRAERAEALDRDGGILHCLGEAISVVAARQDEAGPARVAFGRLGSARKALPGDDLERAENAKALQKPVPGDTRWVLKACRALPSGCMRRAS